ncbi:MAG TPA: glycosyltransferase family 9 protein [Smithellaceae bacterium]|jgi:ADP-heptose:LPS heptosyltransferase|nr:glycosyltransferase family 9 protein [Smithellaceae bacterium]
MSLDYQNILLIKLRYIGDSINLLPVASNIKKQLPNAHLSVMINSGAEDILSHSKDIDQLICYDRHKMKHNKSLFSKIKSNLDFFCAVRNAKYDLVIDFSGSDRAALITFLSGSKNRWGFNYRDPLTSDPFKTDSVKRRGDSRRVSPLLRLCYHHFIAADISKMHILDYQFSALQQMGFEIRDKKLSIYIPPNIQNDVAVKFPFLNRESFKAVIHPGARMINRRWPGASFAEIANLLKKHYNADIILVSAPEERQLLDEVGDAIDGEVVRLSDLSLIQLAALIKKCDLYIGNDTGTSHLAAAVGVKIVTLFGPQFPLLWAPYTDKGATVFKNLECTGPCNHIECIYDENRCMTLITVDEAWETINQLISKYPKSEEIYLPQNYSLNAE